MESEKYEEAVRDYEKVCKMDRSRGKVAGANGKMDRMGMQCDVPYRGHLTKFFTNDLPIRVCEFD